MKKDEILKLKTDDTSLVIVDEMLFIGSPDKDSEAPDVSFSFEKGQLVVDGWVLTEAMTTVLKMYLNKQI